jgi:photosystem II stability/assembly factor-like uncharacterized protein
MKKGIISLAFILLHCLWAFSQTIHSDYIKELKIRNVGPANMSGRITAIDAVHSNPKIIYVGAASGGVWKSQNGGSAWESIFDHNPTVNVGALAIQQSNPEVIWVGTGEGNPRNSMNLGMGIFKSLDGGKTWTHLGLEHTKTIHRIIVHPANPDIVYVGAMGDPFTPNEHRGVYMTTDGGNSWKRILFTNNNSGVGDMVMDPKNPNKIFAAMYEHRRTPYSFTSGGPGSGLFMTIDGGKSWKKLSHTNGLPDGDLGRIGIAIAPSQPNRIYAKIEATKNALYRSDDGGTSWVLINDNPKFTNNRPFYFQDLAVDSQDPNRLYNIYQPLTVSYDGGLNFDPIPLIPADETKGIHADFHAFWMNPYDSDHFIIGGDGGIGITYDKSKSWYFPESIPVAQCYHIAVDEEMPYNVYAGMQDNGNWSGPGYTWKRGGIRTLYWQYLVGGDGFYISPDTADARFGYGTSQNGDLYRYDKLTGYYVSVKPPSTEELPRLRYNWNAGFARGPFNQSTAYYGSQFVHKTDDMGDSWQVISPDLTRNEPDKQKQDYGGLTIDASGAEFYNSILSIAPSHKDQDVIWVGSDDGLIHITRNGGKTWNNLTDNIHGLPDHAWIARIHASRFDSGTAWVVANNYRQGDYNTYLFKTRDYGKTWTQEADQNVIKGYALSFIQDPIEPNLVFLGTENGLWMSINEGKQWQQVQNGFPSVSTMDLAIQERESALIIGTFGRAIWILDDLRALRVLASGASSKPLKAVPVTDAVQVKGLFINPPGNIWTGFNTTFEGENRPFKKTAIPFYINEVKENTSVQLLVYNSDEQLINTINPPAKPHLGLNYAYWNLDESINLLPRSYTDEESRGIAVLPGAYQVVIQYGQHRDSIQVKVIEDPRFQLNPEVDLRLYQMQKQLDMHRAQFTEAYGKLEKSDSIVQRVIYQLDLVSIDNRDNLMGLSKEIRDQIEQIKNGAMSVRPKKQVGAWQSFDVNAVSKIKDAELALMSKTTLPSMEDQILLEEIGVLVSDFQRAVSIFHDNEWSDYVKIILSENLNWFD